MPTLIILHGWQSSKEKWQKVKQELEKSGLRVLVPDLPGFKPQTKLNQAWDLNNYLNWLEGFIKKSCTWQQQGSGGEGFFVLGHSFGGRIAIKYAAKAPQGLKGLILVSAAGIKDRGLKMSFCWWASKMVKVLRIDKCPLWEPLKKFFYYYILRRKDYISAQGPLRQTMALVVDEDLTPVLENITVPTLVVWGSQDKITALRHGQLMQERIPNARLEVLKNTGHTPHLTCPLVLARKIQQFVDYARRGLTSHALGSKAGY